jgi:hypothetical protein
MWTSELPQASGGYRYESVRNFRTDGSFSARETVTELGREVPACHC